MSLNSAEALTQEEVLTKLDAWNEAYKKASDADLPKLVRPFQNTLVGDLDFEGNTFGNRVNLSGATFVGKANFRECKFQKEANFSHIRFVNEATFVEAEFADYLTSFVDSHFCGGVSFAAAKFFERPTFGGAIFPQKSYFQEVHFKNGVNFYRAQFTDTAWFDQANFEGATYFRETLFKGDANFYVAQLGGRMFFEHCQFHKEVSFHRSNISGIVYFIGDGEKSLVFTPSAEVLFQSTILQDGTISFSGVDLSNSSFVNTDVQAFHFVGIRWDDKPGQRQLYDEKWSRGLKEVKKNADIGERRPSLAIVETLYRQLRKNYEDKADFPEAGKFYAREMEMKRLQKTCVGRNLSLSAWYKYVSDYGESYLRASLWIAGVLFLWAFAYRAIPFQSEAADTVLLEEQAVISLQNPVWPIRQDCREIKECGFLSWQAALTYSFGTMAFSRPSYVKPVSDLGRITRLVQQIVGPVIIALFALAVRRRFRR